MVDRVHLLLPIVNLLLLLRLWLVLLHPLRLHLFRLIPVIIRGVFPYPYYSYCIVVVMVPFSFVLLLSDHPSHDDSYVSSCYGYHVS